MEVVLYLLGNRSGRADRIEFLFFPLQNGYKQYTLYRSRIENQASPTKTRVRVDPTTPNNNNVVVPSTTTTTTSSSMMSMPALLQSPSQIATVKGVADGMMDDSIDFFVIVCAVSRSRTLFYLSLSLSVCLFECGCVYFVLYDAMCERMLVCLFAFLVKGEYKTKGFVCEQWSLSRSGRGGIGWRMF